ncbi:hypothetical protein [uncultured Capnocytophaga sp.]|uniref:hypothetical protein n=1 Tax=uncultured Capnocytophaga sp. TaxID=159273 RepID=UPI0026087869|nr:hypothetical protein [uncultured Capnocytophaga sp.]
MKYKTVILNEKDYLKLKKISDKRNITLTKLYSLLIAYLEKNESKFFPDLFFDETEKKEEEEVIPMEVLTQKELKKLFTHEINRLIGFIKKQDEMLGNIRHDISDKSKQILFKMIPKEEQELSEYHPLFDDYDNTIIILKNYIYKKGIKPEELEEDIKRELGENVFNEYIRYSENVIKKNFLE